MSGQHIAEAATYTIHYTRKKPSIPSVGLKTTIHDPSHQEAADISLKLHGNWKWQPQIYLIKF
jgi:hypothetical protein